MKRFQTLAGSLLVGLLAFGLANNAVSQPVAEPETLQPAFLKVLVPIGATLEIEGIKTNQAGEVRRFMSPPLAAGKKYEYTLKATITENGKTFPRELKVSVTPGQEITVDLRADAKIDPKKEDPKKEDPKKEDPKKEMKKEEKDPKKEEPKKVEPKKEEPKKEEPKKVEPKKEEPKKVEVKKEEPKNEPKKEEPKKIEVKKEEPKNEPKKEEPKKIEVKKEEPKNEPKKEEPKTKIDEPLKVNPKKIDDPAKVEPKKVEPKKEEKTIVVPYVSTPYEVVDAMLKLAEVKEGETVYDLGCGDGRIVISAVKKYKAKKGYGLDLNPERVKESIANAKKDGVEDKLEFKQGDVLKLTDVSEANVVTLYLLPEVNLRLMPVLQKTLKPGSRIVSHDFDMGDWKPEKEIKITDQDGIEHTVYLWVIPKK